MRFLFVIVLFIFQLNAESKSAVSQVSFKEAVDIMKNFCANPKAINHGDWFDVSCDWCPSESTVNDSTYKLDGDTVSFKFSEAIKGNFSGTGEEILLNSNSCEVSSGVYTANSTVLLNQNTSKYTYIPGLITMGQCVKYSTHGKDGLVCHQLNRMNHGVSDGDVSQYILTSGKWEKTILLKTATGSNYESDKKIEININKIDSHIEKGIVTDTTKIVVDLTIFEGSNKITPYIKGREQKSSSIEKEYKLSYTLTNGVFILDDDTKDANYVVMSKLSELR